MSTVLEKAFAKATLLACKGYLPTFIDNSTQIHFEKIVPAALKHALPQVEGNANGVLHYTICVSFHIGQCMFKRSRYDLLKMYLS